MYDILRTKVSGNSMDESVFEALAERLERDAAENPRLHRIKVVLMALLGYFFIASVLTLVAGGIAALAYMAVSVRGSEYLVIKLLGVLLPLGYIICRSLWVSLPPPEGLEINLDEAPALRSMIEELRHLLQTPKIDVVLLTMEFNAGVMQVPRLGVFGWPRNYVVLGWPMLLALSPEGFKSVLAHEFGHLSSSHGRFSAWVYRIRETWFKLMSALEASGQWGTGLFRWFFGWYAPAFGAYSFVQARKHEFAADRMAALVTGGRTTAETLLATVVREAHLETNFWQPLQQQASMQAAPPDDLFARMRVALAAAIPEESAERWARKAKCFKTGGADTHPSLSNRLAALGSPDAKAPPAPSRCAAEELFSDERRLHIEKTLSAKWKENVSGVWSQAHQDGRGVLNRLAELETLAMAGKLDLDQSLERLRHVGDLYGVTATEPLLKELAALVPTGNPQLEYGIGRLLLHQGDRAGVEHIEKAMDSDADAVMNGCGLIIEFFYERGMRAEAEPYLERQNARQEILLKDQEERETLPFSDVYLPHELPADVVAGLARALTAYEHLCEAYLVRKKLTYRANPPLYVLGIRLATSFFKMWAGPAAEGGELCDRISRELALPGQFLILHLHDENEPLLKHLSPVPGSMIYKKRE